MGKVKKLKNTLQKISRRLEKAWNKPLNLWPKKMVSEEERQIIELENY